MNDDHLHECVCGDWHPGSFYAEATAAVPLDVERLRGVLALIADGRGPAREMAAAALASADEEGGTP